MTFRHYTQDERAIEAELYRESAKWCEDRGLHEQAEYWNQQARDLYDVEKV